MFCFFSLDGHAKQNLGKAFTATRLSVIRLIQSCEAVFKKTLTQNKTFAKFYYQVYDITHKQNFKKYVDSVVRRL
jgi:hypothetical protein